MVYKNRNKSQLIQQQKITVSSAIVERLCDMPYQLKSCHLLHNCMKKNHILKGLQQVHDLESR